MNKIISISSYLIIALNAILLLFAFNSDLLRIPKLFMPIGRMHPLLLHLPIGSFITLILIFLFKKEIPAPFYLKLKKFLWAITSLTAATSGIMGLFLNAEGGYNADLIFDHKWLGVAFSLFCLFIFYWIELFNTYKFANSFIYTTGLVLIGLTGHFGANITHGEGYILEAFNKKEDPFDLNASLFQTAIQPIFENKCYSCHNNQKKKGELNFENIKEMLKGGKEGVLWVAGNALESHLIKRLNLPEEDKKHMPPKNKPQLTKNEILLITEWINEGADINKSIASFQDNSPIKKLVINNLEKIEEKSYTFSHLSESKLSEINTPFCTVSPIAFNSPALHANFYVSAKFDLKTLKNLEAAKEQLIALNLAKMPLKDEDLTIISKFKNLETLNLNSTQITGKGLKELIELPNMENISINLVKLDFFNLNNLLKNAKNLKNVYLWENGLSSKELKKLQKENNTINLNYGYVPDPNYKTRLTAPKLVNENFILVEGSTIEFTHVFKNAKIQYKITNSDNNSENNLFKIYNEPIKLQNTASLTVFASLPNWLNSDTLTYYFNQSTHKADSIILLTQPNNKYKGNGAKTLIDQKAANSLDFIENEWIGFRNKKVEGIFVFNENKPIKSISINYLQKIPQYIYAPSSIKVFGSNTQTNFKLLATKNIALDKNIDSKKLSTTLYFESKNYKFYKLVITPLFPIPKGLPGASEVGWLFIDEIFFN